MVDVVFLNNNHKLQVHTTLDTGHELFHAFSSMLLTL